MNISSCLTRQFDYCHEPAVGLVFCFFSVATYTKLKMFAKTFSRTSLMTAVKKNLPTVQEMWVRFLGWEEPLEKEMATHSSILA